jgi:sulfatase maturation enzyme AslB (radical SAM superfamily)
LIDERAAGFLSAIGARVVTSIDGPPPYHNTFREGKNCFAKTQDGVAHLRDHDVPTTVVMTVCNDSLQYIDWCAEWAHEMNVEAIQFQPLEMIGRGTGIASKRLSEDKLNDLFLHLSDLAVRYAAKGLKVMMTMKSRDHMKTHPCAAFVCNGKRCHRGVEKELKKLVIRENGDILPELVDIDRRFAVGNLHKATLKENIVSYLSAGYAYFDSLCREVYKDTVLHYPSPLVPWNEILTERSRSFRAPTSAQSLEQKSSATNRVIPVAVL